MGKTETMTPEEHRDSGFEKFTSRYKHDPELKLTRISTGSFTFGIWLFKINAIKTFGSLDGISRDGLMTLLCRLGYYKRYRSDNTFDYIHEHNNIIMAVEISQIRDAVNKYVNSANGVEENWQDAVFKASEDQQREIFLRNSPSLFNDAILGHLPNHNKPILHDTETEMFFPFNNCVVCVTSEKSTIIQYAELRDKCIWKDHITDRSYTYSEDYRRAQYASFINNVANGSPERIDAFHSAIGYLLHNFSYPTTARAVIAYDEQIAGKNEPAGGTGKGLFNQGLKQLRNVAVIDGKKIRDDNPFSYQMVTERTQIISFDDVRPNYDFLTLNSNLTTGWQIEHKNKPSFRFAPSENPKTYITSNTILTAEGPTAKRRQFIIEFSPFYSNLVKKNIEPIMHTHGGMFFTSDWSLNEWNRFFSFMFNCAKFYLENGLKFYKLVAVADNKLIQTTSDDFITWIKDQKFENAFNMTELFTDFKTTYYGDDSEFKQRTFTNWLKVYATTIGKSLKISSSNGKRYGTFISKQ